jgi:hypothetical protein
MAAAQKLLEKKAEAAWQAIISDLSNKLKT